jgi:hypothetical protein
VVIRQQVGDGSPRILASATLPAAAPSRLTVQVDEDRVTVRLPGVPPVSAVFDNRLHEGGVGFSLAGGAGSTVTFDSPTLTPTT